LQDWGLGIWRDMCKVLLLMMNIGFCIDAMKLFFAHIRDEMQAGFSLMELLVVVGIIALLAAVAVPMFLTNIPKYRLKGAARAVVSDFQRTKLEAVKRNCNVEIRFTPGAYNANGGVGSYSIVEMTGGATLLSRTMPQYVTLYTTNLTANKSGYNSQGLTLPGYTGSVYLVNNQATSYKLSISTAGHVSMSMQTVVGPLTAW
jgi:prepilin-type N-terminal cleavage/methylation domain-containing protein